MSRDGLEINISAVSRVWYWGLLDKMAQRGDGADVYDAQSSKLIRRLPDEVVIQIKSSSTITSLKAVVLGLVRNSLDASSTRIEIDVDFVRGNCVVEDDGEGILPSEFGEGGGLGKPYCEYNPVSALNTLLMSPRYLQVQPKD